MESPPPGIEALGRVVDSLWRGIDEDARAGLAGPRIEPEGAADLRTPLVRVAPRTADGSLELVVSAPAIWTRLRARADYAWRPALARALRRAVVEATSTVPEPTGAAEPGPDIASDPRMSYVETSAAMDPFGSGARPAPAAARTARPPSPARRAARGTLALLAAPARFAFRRRAPAGPVARAGLLALRLVTAVCYVATVAGCLFVVCRAVAALVAGPDEEDAFAASEPAAPVLEEVSVAGHRWIVPTGWMAEETAEGALTFQGPNGARLEVLPLPSPGPLSGLELARACVGDRFARVAAGADSRSWVDGRYEDDGEQWHVRCLVRGGALLRASAPWVVYVQEHLEEWLLVVALNVEWRHETGRGRDG